MTDVFGSSKQVHSADQVTNWSGILISIDGTIHLAQSANLQYQRQIQPVYELGSEDIWAGATPAQGTFTIQRAIGMGKKAGKAFSLSTGCSGKDIRMTDGNGVCTDKFGIVTMRNAVPQSYSIQATAGQHIVTEDATFWVGSAEAN